VCISGVVTKSMRKRKVHSKQKQTKAMKVVTRRQDGEAQINAKFVRYR